MSTRAPPVLRLGFSVTSRACLLDDTELTFNWELFPGKFSFWLKYTAETLSGESVSDSRVPRRPPRRPNEGITPSNNAAQSFSPLGGVFGPGATSFLQCTRSLKKALFLIHLCINVQSPRFTQQMFRLGLRMCKHRAFPYNPSPSSVWPALWAGFFLVM